MTVIQMSDRELTRLRVMIDLGDGRLTLEAAGTLMGIGRRQVFRLRRAFEASGASGLISRKRGRASNRKRGETFRHTVLALIREHYPDFGPTLAVEKLIERHGLCVGVETLRQWMMADGLWIDRRHKLPSPHQPRRRRECLGELVQIDGSEHAWFEDRGETCTLLAFVDDATSRLMQLRFVASESAFDYFRGEQTAGRDAGVGEGATGRVRAAQASTRSSAATAAEQSGGTRPANEGSAPETWCRRSTRLNSEDRFHCIPLCNGERPCREAANPTARHP